MINKIFKNIVCFVSILIFHTNILYAQANTKRIYPFPCDSVAFAPLMPCFNKFLNKDIKYLLSDKRFKNFKSFGITEEPPWIIADVELLYDSVTVKIYLYPEDKDIMLQSDSSGEPFKRRPCCEIEHLYPLRIWAFEFICIYSQKVLARYTQSK